MIRSMTGFGEAERETDFGRLRVEIKTVNHRSFNLSLRTPAGFDRYEHQIEGWLRQRISRGHVRYALEMEEAGGPATGPLPELDLERARRYRELLGRLQDELGVPGVVDVATLVRFGQIFTTPEPRALGERIDAGTLRELTDGAAAQVVELREIEGRRLRDDMERGLDAISVELDRVEEEAPERLLRERDRLREQVRELAGREDVDEDRLAREVAYLAEKWDINEEIVRFRSHVNLFRTTLEEGDEAVGKRLSFLAQEMLREANTIGAKANDSSIGHAAVGMKEEIERLREQLENVE